MKFTTKIFWCQMNYTDSARVKAVLQNLWYEYTKNIEEAELVIFVTCSVRQKAEDKITWFIKEIPSNKKIWITGCMSQHYLRTSKILKKFFWQKTIPDNMKVWNFIDSLYKPNLLEKYAVVWFENIDKVNQKLENWTKIIPVNHCFNPFFYNLHKKFENIELVFRIDDTWLLPIILKAQKNAGSGLFFEILDKQNNDFYDEYTDIIPQATTMIGNSKNMNQNVKIQKSAFVPISTWCSQFCHYCIVPFSRWLERHFSKEKVLKEVKFYLDQWVEEITLLGQIVNKHPQFVEIIKEILSLRSNLKRLRYTSPYPTYYSQELFDLHQNEPRLCPHIHIPVQSWSNKILKLMNRWYTVEEFKQMIDQIYNLKRKINITTDIIVWYSNETDGDFEQTLDLVRYCRFTQIFIWKYSVRPWTYASNYLQDNISQKQKEQRFEVLDKLFRQIAKEENQQEIWNQTLVMITTINWNIAKWYTENMKNITLNIKKNSDDIVVWDFVRVKIIGLINELMLEGEIL